MFAQSRAVRNQHIRWSRSSGAHVRQAVNHRRRIIQHSLLTEYAHFLAVGGVIYTITDVKVRLVSTMHQSCSFAGFATMQRLGWSSYGKFVQLIQSQLSI